ncbi:MAG: RND transporter [Gammaproteobacteria bacterium]|nr:MAG: RND transporter [Gammaproteobacteria bacterium]
MQRLIAWWVKNPVAANLLMLGILLAGYLGFLAMEREAFPQVKPNQVTVSVAWPGAAPQEVEEQIVQRIEDALSDLDNIKRIYASAQENFASLEIQTYPNVDINAFVNDVRNAVDAINGLPRDIEPPTIMRTRFRQETIRVGLYAQNVSERTLARLAEDLRDEMAALPYVSLVNLFGTRQEEVTIELSEQAMARYGLSFDQVASAIRASSINLSSGRVRTDTGDVVLRVRNLADTATDFERIVIRQTTAGAAITVGDVAKVIDGFEDEDILATLNGEPAVLLQVEATDRMQVVKSSNAVREWIAQRSASLPEGVSLILWSDNADIYKSRMNLIGKASYQGLLLVFLVLILTLRPYVALWVTAGIGIAFIGSFALLPMNDVSLNVMSTFAFLLVLGIVVDDAIVVGESIHEHASRKMPGPEAAVVGTSMVARPVIFAVLSTVVAFAPWLFVSGETAQVTRQLSIVITVALMISLIEAFFILPAHLRHLKHRDNLGPLAKRQRSIERGILHFADRHYRRLLALAIRQRYLTASLFIAAFATALTLFSSGWVKFYFMPQVEAESIRVRVVLPTGTPYSRALEILEQLQTAERQLIKEIEEEAEREGKNKNIIDHWYTRSSRQDVMAILKLSPPDVRPISAKETAERFRTLMGAIPDAEEIMVDYSITDNGSDVSYLMHHRDSETLRLASRELQRQLQSYASVFYVNDSMRGESDELLMSLKPGAEKLGLSLAQVSAQVRQAYYGEEVQRLPRETGDVRVMLKYPRDKRYDLSSLDQFRVRTSDGREIPLLSVVDISIAKGVQRIQRRDGKRVIYVNADMNDDAIEQVNRDIEENYLPELQKKYPGLEVLTGGNQEAEQLFLQEITSLYIVALFAMYALIAVAFKSYWLPLLVMTAIPFGFMGAVYGHLLFNMPLALFSYFGIGAAAGVVVNDNLVLVDYIGRLRDQGKSAMEAIVDAGVNRFRPILLTTITTVVGLLPIMAEQATDAQFLKPAVLSLAFGVLFALLVTLLLVPALYLIGDDCRRGIGKLKGQTLPAG